MTGPACGVIINSPCTLEAVDAEEVDAELDGALCVPDGGCARYHRVSVCRTHEEREQLAQRETYCTCAARYTRPP